MKTLKVQTKAQWRKWLIDHHDSEAEVWLVFHKRHTGQAAVAYEDALDEALCFGWIDSLIKRLDAERYARKFTPRKLVSRWSDINRERYARLKASGRLMPAGLKRAPTDLTSDRPKRMPWPRKIPRYIEDELKKRPGAWNYFEKLASSHRRRYVGWIDSAKQAETKMRRLQEAVRLLSAGKQLGLK